MIRVKTMWERMCSDLQESINSQLQSLEELNCEIIDIKYQMVRVDGDSFYSAMIIYKSELPK